MFKLSTKTTTDDEFEKRSKSIFDTLANLENTHRSVADQYVDKSLDNQEIIDPELVLIANNRGEEQKDVFKMPPPIETIKRSASEHEQSNKKRLRKQPDYELNPQKWKKYSLDDVTESQMSPSANYFAAMNFLNRNQTSSQTVEQSAQIVFNKPIGGKKKPHREEQPNTDEDDQEEPMEVERKPVDEKKFKKISSRRNLRRKQVDEPDEEIVHTNQIVENTHPKPARDDDDEAEFENYQSNEVDENDEAEFENNNFLN